MSSPEQGEAESGCRVAIIGGGFTGWMLAVELLRMTSGNISSALIECSRVPGPGLAYGTEFEGNLLNVPAKNMSAYRDAPNHFLGWAQRNYKSTVEPSDFLARALYGRYIASQLREAMNAHPGKLRCVQGQAMSLTRASGRAVVHLSSGQSVVADKVALALGNFPPGELSFAGKTPDRSRYLANPWSLGTSIDVTQDKGVLLLGSGLTSVDVAMELRARGFQGTIHILSRRGLLPHSHKASAPHPPFWNASSPRTVRGLLRLIRGQIRVAQAQGSDWRAVIDSLRPVSQQIWRTLPRLEQRRFLRHLRPYWDVHRHRIAQQLADDFATQLRNGRIRMLAGNLLGLREERAGVEVTYRERKSDPRVKLHVQRDVNCTGPTTELRLASPLVADLINKKLVRPHELSLGLDVASDGAVLDAQGGASNFLYALGPLRKGNLWESVAVPEIRVQVSELALLLAGDRHESLVPGGIAAPKFSNSLPVIHIPKETRYA